MDPEVQQLKKHKVMVIGALIAFVIAILTGTVVFHLMEGWRYVDSFYFTSVTMLTIGYGDLVPTTDASKILTVLFSFAGVSVALYTLFIIGEFYISRRSEIYYLKLYRYMKHTKKDKLTTTDIKKIIQEDMPVLKEKK